ncbi:acetyl-CoA synthetase-like protein [Earliella scabrosa]|nr:acetyl-CoA synthetase-like protein [Earliella scabrosa]
MVSYVSSLATPQGKNSATFHPAPLDHGLSVPGLYEYHARNSPDHPVFTYSDTATQHTTDVLYRDAWSAISTIAGIILDRCNDQHTPTGTGNSKRPVIAVLALADSLSYIYTLVAIMSLGYTAFPLSPRSSSTVTAHLLETTGASQLLVSDDAAMQSLAQAAIAILEQKGVAIAVQKMLRPEDYRQASSHPGMVDIGDDDVTVFYHSSGTTGLPKPIPMTRRGLVNASNAPCYGEVDLADKRIAAHTNPIPFGMGLATVVWPLSTGAIFALYKPVLPPITPTPANFLECCISDKCRVIFCVPVFVETWARDPKNLPVLQSVDAIAYGGAPLNKEIGNMLVTAGVTLHPLWGCTEMGPATMFIPRDPPAIDTWQYFKISRNMTVVMQPQDLSRGLYEPISLPGEAFSPFVTNTEFEGQRAFAVGDLLEQHPTDPSRWRVFGRKDDQIILSIAERVNPVPTEAAIAQSPLVGSVVMFGTHHINIGILVEPAAGHEVDLVDGQKVAEYIDAIWPAIEAANRELPEFARIARNMILLASPAKPLEHTPKGTARRAVCLRMYASEVEALYAKEQEGIDVARNRLIPDRV